MRDEEVSQVQLLLQVFEHVDDLGLNRDVQRGDRLIADNELGVDSQRTGDADTLLLTAGELVREAVGMFRVQADAAEQLVDAVAAVLLRGAEVVNIQRLADDFTDRHTRVQGAGRVLEDDLHLAAVRLHGDGNALLLVENRRAAVEDLPGSRFIQTDDGAPEGGFTAAGLTDEAQGLALIDEEGDVLYGLYISLVEKAGAFDGEILAEIFDLDQFFSVVHDHSPFAPFFMKCFQQAEMCPPPISI